MDVTSERSSRKRCHCGSGFLGMEVGSSVRERRSQPAGMGSWLGEEVVVVWGCFFGMAIYLQCGIFFRCREIRQFNTLTG